MPVLLFLDCSVDSNWTGVYGSLISKREGARTMRVRVTLTVDVDPDAWEMTYGTPRFELREDVREYVREHVQGSAAADEGAILGVRMS